MKKVVHFEVHFVILYSKTELLSRSPVLFFIVPKNPGKADKTSFSWVSSGTYVTAPFIFYLKVIQDKLTMI